ncbi:MAG: bacillithiol biosynthesis deacetylase BshB1 [Planctomycetota bacterium]
MTPGFDVMVLAPHPDDAEIACAGVLLQLVAAGRRTCVVDLTRGEMGSRGDTETRAQECDAATGMLGIEHRRNLGLPDAMLRDDDDTLAQVVGVIRELQPRILLAPHWKDVHPDHRAGAEIARRAFFHSGLRNYNKDVPAFRPALLAHYPGNDPIVPSFCVDISAEVEAKRRVIECYASQVQDADASHMVRKVPYLRRVEARDRYFGGFIGCAAAEPFFVEGPLSVRSFTSLLET